MITCYPDVEDYDIKLGWDFIVMGCDGIWEVKDNKQICEIVRNDLKKDRKLKDIAEDLLNKLLAQDTS